jgi:hypothetical protein
VVAAVSCTAQNSFPLGNLLAPVDSTLHEKKKKTKMILPDLPISLFNITTKVYIKIFEKKKLLELNKLNPMRSDRLNREI